LLFTQRRKFRGNKITFAGRNEQSDNLETVVRELAEAD
jgi:hypothetical protein